MAARKKARSVKRGACSFTVTGVKKGDTFYGKKFSFPVSWRGRDAAARMAKRKGFRHAVLALECGGKTITLTSCNTGKCETLGGSSNRRQENKHRGKAKYNTPIAGARKKRSRR